MIYSLSKSRRVLRHGIQLYKKKGQKLSLSHRRAYEELLEKLDHALLARNRKEAETLARQVQKFNATYLPKTTFDHVREFVYAIAFAVVVAFLIRQFWFELYEVPTGSMRPTIEELDRLVVSKTTFGLNFPLQKGLTFFKPEYVQRGGIIVLTVEDMDVPDSDTMYFYLFPGKKRFVKRNMGLSGDTLYFYGGQVYGVDSQGNPITEFTDPEFLKSHGIEKIDHVPYITYEGKVTTSNSLSKGAFGESTFSQMNLPLVKLKLNEKQVEGTFFNGNEWVKEDLNALKNPHPTPQSYSDLWGIGNYAGARLLTKDEAEKFYGPQKHDGILFLELHHTPNLSHPAPEMKRGSSGKIYPSINTFVSLIPLSQDHLNTLFSNLYTARFFIRNGGAYRYNEGNHRPQPPQFDISFPNVPDGLYEFYYGVGYKILPFGFRKELPKDHPLYSLKPRNIQKLFNVGIEQNILFQPVTPDPIFTPQRFAYFREGDLFVMGAPLLKKDDPALQTFIEEEKEREAKSSEKEPYIAFIDRNSPIKDGKLDTDFIKAFGMKVPENHVLALGDNYAMSSDSREFGFVPEKNLRGAPSFIFWPFSHRVGALPQPPYKWITFPNLLIWTLAAIVIIGSYLYFRARNRKPHFKKIDFQD